MVDVIGKNEEGKWKEWMVNDVETDWCCLDGVLETRAMRVFNFFLYIYIYIYITTCFCILFPFFSFFLYSILVYSNAVGGERDEYYKK